MRKEKKPKVSVLVLNYKQAGYTIDCVKSILKQTYTDFEIIIIDNDSQDGSYELLIKEFGDSEDEKKIRVIKTDKNRGYAGGNNFGVREAKGKYIVILNNDTLVDEEWLGWLVKGLESDAKVKIVGSNVRLVGRDKQRDYKNYGETKTLTGYTVSYKRKEPLKDETFINVFSGGGCSFIYDRSMIESPFPEEYFIYAEDTYLNWLTNLRGYEVLKATKSKVDHYHNVVKKTGGKKINFYFSYLAERNIYNNLFIFYNVWNLIRIMPIMLIKILLNNVFQFKKIPAHIKAYGWILTHPHYFHKKRKEIKRLRNIPDKEMVAMMSYKIYDPKKMPRFKLLLKLINKLVYGYCWLVNLKTIEFQK